MLYFQMPTTPHKTLDISLFLCSTLKHPLYPTKPSTLFLCSTLRHPLHPVKPWMFFISVQYFETDDPELYTSKIKFIEENDIEDMELTFIEEEYTERGQLARTVELIPGGSGVKVTNRNKLQYLDCLAQYRLATSIKDEVEHFLRGLNELIPDNLLSIFDEYELEVRLQILLASFLCSLLD